MLRMTRPTNTTKDVNVRITIGLITAERDGYKNASAALRDRG